jgi:hypothetical protein
MFCDGICIETLAAVGLCECGEAVVGAGMDGWYGEGEE